MSKPITDVGCFENIHLLLVTLMVMHTRKLQPQPYLASKKRVEIPSWLLQLNIFRLDVHNHSVQKQTLCYIFRRLCVPNQTMGNDGGSIPTRRELVKNAARNPNHAELRATQLEAQTHAWEQCPLSHRPLVPPIVSDSGGILYNKDAILEHLLPKDEDIPTSIIKEKEDILQGRVKGLRDIVEVKFTVSKDGKKEKKICPVTSKELGPHTKAVYLVPCGHAFSEVAIREVAENTCVECNQSYETENVIPILSLAKEDLERLNARAGRLKEAGLTHSLKKTSGSKKRKKGLDDKTTGGAINEHSNGKSKSTIRDITDIPGPGLHDKMSASVSRSGTSTPMPSGIKNAATASLTAKVLEEQEERNKRRKLGLNDNLKTLFSNTGYNAHSQKGGDFMTRGFSLPNNK